LHRRAWEGWVLQRSARWHSLGEMGNYVGNRCSDFVTEGSPTNRRAWEPARLAGRENLHPQDSAAAEELSRTRSSCRRSASRSRTPLRSARADDDASEVIGRRWRTLLGFRRRDKNRTKEPNSRRRGRNSNPPKNVNSTTCKATDGTKVHEKPW
jgi:hypothetical protein